MSTVDERPAGGTNVRMTTTEVPPCPSWCTEQHPDDWMDQVRSGGGVFHFRYFGQSPLVDGICIEQYVSGDADGIDAWPVMVAADQLDDTPASASPDGSLGCDPWVHLTVDMVQERIDALTAAADFLRSLEAGR